MSKIRIQRTTEGRIPFRALAPSSRLDRLRLRVRRRLSREEAANLEAALEDERQWEALPKLSVTPRSSVARLSLPSGPVAIKRYEEPGVYALRTLARRSRAEREARALDLIAGAFPANAVRPLAWAETRRLGFVTRSHLVTNELQDSFDLRAVKELTGDARARAVTLVLEELPGIVASLHDAGIHLRSLRGKNVLLQPALRVVALIDQPLATAPRHFGLRHRVRDLASLSVELRRFLDDAQWQTFLDVYLARSLDLLPEARSGIDARGIEAAARRLRHRTPLRALAHKTKRRLGHTRAADWLTGRARRLGAVR